MNPAARHIRQDDASAGGVRSEHGSQCTNPLLAIQTLDSILALLRTGKRRPIMPNEIALNALMTTLATPRAA
jgi:hypothetical protein